MVSLDKLKQEGPLKPCLVIWVDPSRRAKINLLLLGFGCRPCMFSPPFLSLWYTGCRTLQMALRNWKRKRRIKEPAWYFWAETRNRYQTWVGARISPTRQQRQSTAILFKPEARQARNCTKTKESTIKIEHFIKNTKHNSKSGSLNNWLADINTVSAENVLFFKKSIISHYIVYQWRLLVYVYFYSRPSQIILGKPPRFEKGHIYRLK